MKRLLPLVLLALTGCTLFNKNATTDQKVTEVYRLSRVAANTGATLDLIARPRDKPIFEQAYAALDNALVLSNLTAATLHQVFTNLPITQLKDPRAVLLIDNAVFLFDQYTGEQINIESNLPYVFAAGRGMHDGIGSALGRVIPSPLLQEIPQTYPLFSDRDPIFADERETFAVRGAGVCLSPSPPR